MTREQREVAVGEAEGIREAVAAYYTNRLAEHGTTARGVDWKDAHSQEVRFDQLLELMRARRNGSVVDYGCGYGAFLPYMRRKGFQGTYCGIDVSESMIEAARAHCTGETGADFAVGLTPPEPADFCIASGIFNVRLDFANDEWLTYIHSTLDDMNGHSRLGFAFNCLTSYSDADRMRGDLYYADPLALFDRCKRNYARNVALLHDYDLYEFTIIVRKDGGAS